MKRPTRPRPVPAPFWRWKVPFDPTTPCEEWDGAVNRGGYGTMSEGRLAHRIIYAAQVGPIPPGMTVDHGCYNPRCVHPGHLRLMTLSENSSNQQSKYWTECIHGHPYNVANTRRDSLGKRHCRACNRIRINRYRAAARAAA